MTTIMFRELYNEMNNDKYLSNGFKKGQQTNQF